MYKLLITALILNTFGTKIDICHFDDEGKQVDISISQNSIRAHLKNGDYIEGNCSEYEWSLTTVSPTVSPTTTSSPTSTLTQTPTTVLTTVLPSKKYW